MLDSRTNALREFNIDRFRRLESAAADTAKSIVPRGEHEQRWTATGETQATMQRQIDEIKKSFGDTFSLRDAMQQLQRRIDMIEQRRLTTSPPQTAG